MESIITKGGRCYKVIYCTYFTHWKTKKRVYRKDGRAFRFEVEVPCTSCS